MHRQSIMIFSIDVKFNRHCDFINAVLVGNRKSNPIRFEKRVGDGLERKFSSKKPAWPERFGLETVNYNY